jgi:hypothetical protein
MQGEGEGAQAGGEPSGKGLQPIKPQMEEFKKQARSQRAGPLLDCVRAKPGDQVGGASLERQPQGLPCKQVLLHL